MLTQKETMTNVHTSCDLQDITRAGITQDIGVVAVVDTGGILLAISSGHSDRTWVKRKVRLEELGVVFTTQVFHKDIDGAIQEGIDFCAHEKPPKTMTYACDILFSHRTYVNMRMQSDGKLVIEIEDFDRQLLLGVNTIVDTANVIGRLTANTDQVGTANDLCKAVFTLSSYDRAMTYKFLDDLSGEVIYELKDDDNVKSSFLGLRFPAGDIPLSARRAYVDNPVRFIADVHKPSCDLIQKPGSDISLSQSFLRGCVAAHRSYLQAMKVKGSISIAVTTVEGNLWGLVVMHSYTQTIIPTIEDRVTYAILASVTSTQVQNIENAERLNMETTIKTLVSQIDCKSSLGLFIVQNKTALLETFSADSITLITHDGPPTTVGGDGVTLQDLPTELVNEPLKCGRLESPLRSFACLSVLGYKLVFTRRCSYNPIMWAGNPDKLRASEVSPEMARPRQSFEKYMDHRSQNPPPFTKRDRAVLTMTGDLLKSVIHQMKLEYAEKKIVLAQRASHAVEMKSDQNYAFFANMSHELRTPLHAISGIFEIVKNAHNSSIVTDERRREILRYSLIGLDTCNDMMNTLNDILAIVRNTHEKDHVDVSLVMIKDIFNSTSNGLGTFAAKNGVRLKIAFDCHTDKLVRIDVQKTIQIYNNIVGNAIKFTSDEADSRKKVDVRIDILDSLQSVRENWTKVSGEFAGRHVAAEDWNREECMVLCKWMIFQTRDYGVGIRVDDMEKVFEKFTQIHEVSTKKFASTGLGLHVTLLNVRAMRGFVAVASTLGIGSLFLCALPVEDASGERRKSSVDPTAAHPQEFRSDPVNLVVVDDSKINIMIAKKQIERAFVNAKVHTALNGKLAVEQVERLMKDCVHIDGIFMDYHMPTLSGTEASREIRKRNVHVPITMLTADITETSRQNMIASGVDLILLKPSKPQEVVGMCEKMIRMARSRTYDAL